MNTRILFLLSAALLVSAATSEARGRRYRSHAPERAVESSSADEGGPLARSRGLSQGESTAVGVVIAEIASSSSSAGDAAANAPQRRLSPDYYRVYAHRGQAPGTKQRVATKPAAATPQPPAPALAKAATTLAPPAPTPPPAPVAKRLVAAPVNPPPPAPVKPAPKPKIAAVAPTPKPLAVQAPTTTPRRVLMLPPGSTSRKITVPVSAPTAPARKRKADVTIYATTPPPTGATPIRAVFADPVRR
jgi:hypothetical protein